MVICHSHRMRCRAASASRGTAMQCNATVVNELLVLLVLWSYKSVPKILTVV